VALQPPARSVLCDARIAFSLNLFGAIKMTTDFGIARIVCARGRSAGPSARRTRTHRQPSYGPQARGLAVLAARKRAETAFDAASDRFTAAGQALDEARDLRARARQ